MCKEYLSCYSCNGITGTCQENIIENTPGTWDCAFFSMDDDSQTCESTCTCNNDKKACIGIPTTYVYRDPNNGCQFPACPVPSSSSASSSSVECEDDSDCDDTIILDGACGENYEKVGYDNSSTSTSLCVQVIHDERCDLTTKTCEINYGVQTCMEANPCGASVSSSSEL